MKTKRTSTIAAVLVALAALLTLGMFRETRPARAQDEPPPNHERISFGMVGITHGQTVRLSVTNSIMPSDANWPPGPTRVVLNFRNLNGQLVRNRSGEVVRKVVELERGESTFLDLNDHDWPPGPSRLQLRAVVTVTPPPNGVENPKTPPHETIGATVEVINDATGRTAFVLSKDPGYRQIVPAQPE